MGYNFTIHHREIVLAAPLNARACKTCACICGLGSNRALCVSRPFKFELVNCNWQRGKIATSPIVELQIRLIAFESATRRLIRRPVREKGPYKCCRLSNYDDNYSDDHFCRSQSVQMFVMINSSISRSKLIASLCYHNNKCQWLKNTSFHVGRISSSELSGTENFCDLCWPSWARNVAAAGINDNNKNNQPKPNMNSNSNINNGAKCGISRADRLELQAESKPANGKRRPISPLGFYSDTHTHTLRNSIGSQQTIGKNRWEQISH